MLPSLPRLSAPRLSAIVLFLAVTGGCGPQVGAFLYHTGLYPRVKVKPKCTLTRGPLLILVDDDQDLLEGPRPRQYLVTELARELADHKVNSDVIDPRKIDRLRLQDAKFEERGTREVGRQLKADQVLWLQVQTYRAPTKLEDFEKPPQFAVTVKVVNALAEKREDVRIWPESRDGQRISVTESYHAAKKAKSADDFAKLLATELAEEIAKLFYEYEITPEEAEQERRRVSL